MYLMFILYTLMFFPLLELSMSYLNTHYMNFIIMMKIDMLPMMFMVSLMIIFYNISLFTLIYMKMNSYMIYFKILMGVFCFSMMLLLLTSSLIMLMFSWELLGVSSYLLVLFYYNWNSLQGSLLTMVTNRIGDSFLMMFMYMTNMKMFVMYMIFIIMMGFSKSAQMPFSSWLPAAMAAPTPVSALVHSSTLVTAGLYLFFKFFMPMFNSLNKELLLMIGLMTMMLGSVKALMSIDTKKIVAFSTLSQLGFMMMIFYSSWLGLMIFHLLTHAFMKSFMFMIMGLAIQSSYSQNLFKMMKSIQSLTMTSLFIMIFMNFTSFIFSSLFLSKELLMSYMFYYNKFFKVIMCLVLMLTLFYMKRLYISLMKLMSYKIQFKFNSSFYLSMNSYFLFFIMMSLLWLLNFLKKIVLLTNFSYMMMLMFSFIFLKFGVVNLYKVLIKLNNILAQMMRFMMKMSFEESLLFNKKYLFFIMLKTLINKWKITFIILMFILLFFMKLYYM